MHWTCIPLPCHPEVPSSWFESGSQKSLVGFEGFKSIAFLFELHGSMVGGCIINEGHPIVIVFSGLNWKGTIQIRMNQLKWLSCT